MIYFDVFLVYALALIFLYIDINIFLQAVKFPKWRKISIKVIGIFGVIPGVLIAAYGFLLAFIANSAEHGFALNLISILGFSAEYVGEISHGGVILGAGLLLELSSLRLSMAIRELDNNKEHSYKVLKIK